MFYVSLPLFKLKRKYLVRCSEVFGYGPFFCAFGFFLGGGEFKENVFEYFDDAIFFKETQYFHHGETK